MNIVIDIRLLASGKFSGIEEYTRQLTKHLIEIDKGNEYTLFYNSFKKRSADLNLNSDSGLIKKYSIPNKLLDASIRFFNRPRIDKLISADLIFSPHFNILAHTASAKRIITIHDLSFLHHPEYFSRRKRFWHWMQNYKTQIMKADHIIAVSDHTKNDIIQLLGINEAKITRVYSGIDPRLKKISQDDRKLKNFRKRNSLLRPFLLYLAALEPRKNVVSVIRAFNLIKEDKEYDDFQLVLAGSTGWLNKEIFKEIENSAVQRDIILLGEIEAEEKVYLYNLASVFIYPSFFEGFGFPPLEAQLCSTPVVASNRSSLPEILGNSALLVDPWRIDDIVNSTKEILDNSILRDLLITRGLENVKKFNWGQAVQETISVFKKYGG